MVVGFYRFRLKQEVPSLMTLANLRLLERKLSDTTQVVKVATPADWIPLIPFTAVCFFLNRRLKHWGKKRDRDGGSRGGDEPLMAED